MASGIGDGASNVPTEGEDDLVGTSGPDAIDGLGGNDTIQGLGGNDSLSGGGGDDSLLGGLGDDNFVGGDGADTIDGGVGFDRVDYSGDAAAGGGGPIIANLSDDQRTVNGIAAAPHTVVDGFGHVDIVTNVEDVVGSTGNDWMRGGNEDNTFVGGGGDDLLNGRGGFDTLLPGAGDDVVYGGSEADEVNYSDAPAGAGLTIDLSDTLTDVDGAYVLVTDPWGGTDKLYSIERVRGTQNADTITGDGQNNRFRSLGGDDILDGGAGIDQVDYSRDVNAGGGAGVIVNLSGAAITVGQTTVGAHKAQDGFGDEDSLTDIENVRGTSAADTLVGDNASNLLQGEGGADALRGGGGDDTLEGGAGVDTFHGTASELNNDRITDYELGESIVLDQSLTPSSTVELHVAGNGTSTELQIDVDGDGNVDSVIRMNGVILGDVVLTSGGGHTNNVIRIVQSGPPAPQITAPSGITNENALTVTGTGQAGLRIRLYDGNTEIGETLVGGNGQWSIDVDGLGEGGHTLTARAIDAQDQEAVSAPVTITIDTMGPEAPALDTGAGLVKDATPTFEGFAEPGVTIKLYKGATLIGTATAGDDGAWSLTVNGALQDGAHDLTLQAVDAAGNVSEETQVEVTVDTTPPGVPEITSSGGLISTDVYTLSGTADPGATINIYDGNAIIGQISADGNGQWSFPLDELPDGSHSFTAKVVDHAGNVSTSSPVQVTVDTTEPETPTVDTAGGLIDSDSLTISGVAEAGAVIKITENGVVIGTTTVTEDGLWTIDLKDLADGNHSYLITATDAAGHESAAEPFGITVDTVTPGAPTVVPPSAIIKSDAIELSGTGEAGTHIELFDGATVLADTYVAPDGIWNIDLTGLADRSYSFVVKATDEAGRTSSGMPVTFTVDTIAPGKPTVVFDDLVNDTTPTFQGTAEPGATVELYDGNTLLASATTGGNGAWTITVPANQALSVGVHTLKVVAKDVAGHASTAAQFTIEVDTTTAAPTVDPVGTVKPGPVTLSGVAEAGASIEVRLGNVLIGETVADGAGLWSLETEPLGQGQHNLTVTAIDPAGNPASTTVPVTATGALELALSQVALLSDTGGSGFDFVTSNGTVTLSGTADPGSTLTFYGGPDSTTKLNAAITVGSTGHWSILMALPEGSHNLSVRATDGFGNSKTTEVWDQTVVVDKTAPAGTFAPALVADTGTSVSDRVTKDDRVVLAGTGESGAKVTVYDNGAVVDETTVDGNGQWSLGTRTLSQGSHQLSARIVDLAGNQTTSAAAGSITVDTAIALTLAQTLANDTGTSDDNITRNGGVTLSGMTDPGASVVVKSGATVLGTVTAAANGSWSFMTSLVEGTHTLSATATDRAGNLDTKVAASVTVDRTGPAKPAITGLTTTPAIVNGQSADNTPTLTGTAEGNSLVRIYANGVQVGVTTAGADGTWSVTTSALPDGFNSLTARAEDKAGNLSVASGASTIVVDSAPPEAPAIVSIHSDTGESASDGVTSDGTLIIRGTAEAGATIRVFEGDTLRGTVTAGSTGLWTLDLTSMPMDGTHVFTATATDRSNLTSGRSGPFTVQIDKGAPTGTSITGVITDTKTVSNGETTNDTTVTLEGEAEAGVKVEVYVGTIKVGTAEADGTGHWSLNHTLAALDGQVAFTAKAVDLAGNSHTSGLFEITLDRNAPTPVITGASTTSAGTVLSGTAEAGSKVEIFEGFAKLGEVTAKANGTWTVTVTKLTDVMHTLHAVATDSAGNVGTQAGVTVTGSTKLDALGGTAGADVLLGAGGTDTLDGGAGDDRYSGGAGIDTFVFAGQFGSDTVVDYQDGYDRFDLDAGVTFGNLQITAVDADADGATDDVQIKVSDQFIKVLNTQVSAIDTLDFI